MKRIVAIIGILLALGLQWSGVTDFDNAQNSLQTFKALFWIAVGTIALLGFIDDFKQNKWPI